MTYKEIYEQFLVTSGFDKNNIADYRPSYYVDSALNQIGIVVYLKDGNRLIYIADVEIKGYAYFKDEHKEREVIIDYEFIDTGAIKFRTKSGEYIYYISIERAYDDGRLIGTCECHQFGKIEDEVITYYGPHETVNERTTSIDPCDIEMIELWGPIKIIKSCSRKYY